MSTQYAGLCIGGPYAGRSISHHSVKLRVQEKPPVGLKEQLKESIRNMEDFVETHTYNWLHTGGLGLWIAEPMTMNDAIEALALAYMEKHNGA